MNTYIGSRQLFHYFSNIHRIMTKAVKFAQVGKKAKD